MSETKSMRKPILYVTLTVFAAIVLVACFQISQAVGVTAGEPESQIEMITKDRLKDVQGQDDYKDIGGSLKDYVKVFK